MFIKICFSSSVSNFAFFFTQWLKMYAML